MDMDRITSRSAILGLASVLLLSTPAFSHGDAEHATPPTKKAIKAEQMDFGIAGDPKKATRTIDVDAHDTFRYSPDKITVKRGQTVRFVMRNKGNILHEIVIGTPKELEEHAALMKKFPEMEHEAPYMLHVQPGKSGEIVWRFNRSGTFQFACLIAGHFEAGMVGTVVVL